MLSGFIMLWASAAGLGFLGVVVHHSTPNDGGSPADRWPPGSRIPRDRSRPTLLIFVHPRCPCSSASLEELGRVAARSESRFAAHLVAFRPEGASEGWAEAGRRLGGDVPGLTRWDDPGGREAARFGVATSGHVLLFDPSGRRLFGGGITIARGHRGDNPGLDELVGSLREGDRAALPSPVFGCPIFETGPPRSSAEPTP